MRRGSLSRLMLFNRGWATWKVGNQNLWNASIAPSTVYSSPPIFLGKVYSGRRKNGVMYWASKQGMRAQNPTQFIKLPGHGKYQLRKGEMSLGAGRDVGKGAAKQTPSQRCFPLTSTAFKKWNLFPRQNRVKHSCALHPLSRFKYWPVFSVFVLVPSAHTGVHGLFPSLIILPPAALAENGVIIQQAVRGFPSRVFTAPHSSGARLPGQQAAGGTLLQCALLTKWKQLGKQSEERALKRTSISPYRLSQCLRKLGCL